MTGQAANIPVLRVSSREISDPGPLESLLDSRHPLVLVRHGNGAAGFGVSVGCTFAGPGRFADASRVWREIVAASVVEQAVDIPGSGLVAAGSFTFSDESSDVSRLIVPAVVIGRRGGRAWITVIGGAENSVGPALGPRPSVNLSGETDTFTSAVATAVSRIRAGELDKVVLARRITGSLPPGADLRAAVSTLAERYPDALTFAVDGLIGASPETLVRVEGQRVTSRVLAGTAARGAADPSALLSSAKDRSEHDLARRSVLTALAEHTSGLTAGPPFVLELPNLLHLASDIEGTLSDGSSALDLVAALHPTAAVAGTPTDAALGLIGELEAFDRRRYAGPVGWVGADGDGEWAVALRCAEVSGGMVTAYAGAGIVAASDPATELAETELKFRPIREAFGSSASSL